MMIRNYQEADWPSIRDIYDLSKADEMRGSVDPALILPFEQDPNRLTGFRRSQIVVAEREGVIEGFGGLDGSMVSWLFVHPSHRRKGVATALIRELHRRRNGELELNVAVANHPARTLYEKLGFVVKREFEGMFEGVPVKVVRMHKSARLHAADGP